MLPMLKGDAHSGSFVRIMFIAAVVLLSGSYGCSVTPLSLRPEAGVNLSQYRSLSVQTTTSQGVLVSAEALERIKLRVKHEINSGCCPGRFDRIRIESTSPEDLLLAIKFTTYDEGNRFARAVLPPAGAIKIYADIEIRDGASGELISKGETGRTFTWDGAIGAAVGVEEIEKEFAKEVSRGFGEMLSNYRPPSRPAERRY